MPENAEGILEFWKPKKKANGNLERRRKSSVIEDLATSIQLRDQVHSHYVMTLTSAWTKKDIKTFVTRVNIFSQKLLLCDVIMWIFLSLYKISIIHYCMDVHSANVQISIFIAIHYYSFCGRNDERLVIHFRLNSFIVGGVPKFISFVPPHLPLSSSLYKSFYCVAKLFIGLEHLC